MRTAAITLALLTLALPSYVLADAQDMAMARVRLTTDSSQTHGCTRLASVRDDSLKDLRRKIVKAGGNTGLLSFGTDDLSKVSADVFNCSSTAAVGQSPAASPRPAPAPPPAEPPLWKPRNR